MELREYVRACRRRWAWLVVPVLIAAGLAAGLALSTPPAYRSSMVLFITTDATDPDSKASRLNSYIALLTGPRVASTVVERVGPPLTEDQVRASLTAQVQDGTDLLVVSATDPSAVRSRQMVTAATTALITLAKQLDPPPTGGGTNATNGPTPSVTIAQDPVTAREPDNLVRNTAFAGVLGLLIGAIAVAVREATRRTVAEEDDLRRLGLGTVGVISLGRSSGLPGEALAEGFRRLRSLLPAIGDGPRGASLLLAGSHPREGTTAVACGLAIAMAETGARVVLVDANLRTPGVGRYLAMDPGPGLADVLAGHASVRSVLRDSLDGRLTVLPCGQNPADPGELLASPRLGAAMRALAETFDVVLVDAPPLQGVADSVVLSKVTDEALLVVRANHTRVADVARSLDLLERVGARPVGAVLNALPRKLPTGAVWHRERAAMPGSAGLGLVTGEDSVNETQVILPDTGPVRGQARVVRTTIGHRPRGRASVVVNLEPTGEPEPPNLPVQRGAAEAALDVDVAQDEEVWEDDPSTDEALADAKPRSDD
ncbi:polysaccharide biosynthesis tyrosine autokinase [Actinoplanes subtropicus]|uniref:polysaccharide biosynthesis tyrosine autokinase n=1 Tax=Actinoplanes subtropicus TaxID=543632 RepID=UPI000AABDBD7|nr:polysaccharide biosynthesis tyrosine autokinase [Actinoplanes subtropicus]